MESVEALGGRLYALSSCEGGWACEQCRFYSLAICDELVCGPRQLYAELTRQTAELRSGYVGV
jgi:hypothetical protein